MPCIIRRGQVGAGPPRTTPRPRFGATQRWPSAWVGRACPLWLLLAPCLPRYAMRRSLSAANSGRQNFPAPTRPGNFSIKQTSKSRMFAKIRRVQDVSIFTFGGNLLYSIRTRCWPQTMMRMLYSVALTKHKRTQMTMFAFLVRIG